MKSPITIRKAKEEDCEAIHGLIVELAVFEKAANEVDISPEDLRRDAFGKDSIVDMLVAETHAEPREIIGAALYYEKYSTWKGRGLHLEDLVVRESYRRHGVGSRLFDAVMRVAAERNCARMDWQVLDWNESAIAFYNKYGADISDEWLNGRFTREELQNAAGGA